jgi:hypothetical protein
MQLIVNLATSSGKSLRVGQISNFSLNQKKNNYESNMYYRMSD